MFQNSPSGVVAYYLIGSLLLLLLVIAIVTYAYLHQKKVIRLRTRLHEEEIRSQQAIFGALQEGEERERTRLAEELHDGVGAKLSGLRMNLEYLKSHTKEHQDLVAKIFAGIIEAVEEIRAISHNLQPYFFKDRNLEQLLLEYMEQLSLLNGCTYDLFMNAPAKAIDDPLKLQCYRIAAELLHNIHKHAKATLASVQINVERSSLEIVAEDNGLGLHGHDVKGEGIGLTNIRNRVKARKGVMTIDSSQKGTTIIIEIPLNPNS